MPSWSKHQTIHEKLVGTMPDQPKVTDHPVVQNQLIENHGAGPSPISSGTILPNGGADVAPESGNGPAVPLKPCDSPEEASGLGTAHRPHRTEWTRHQVTLLISVLQFHIILAVGTTAPNKTELKKSVFRRDPSGRTGG